MDKKHPLLKIRSKKKKSRKSRASSASQHGNEAELIGNSLDANLQLIKKRLGNSSDVIARKFNIGVEGRTEVAVIYTDGLADKNFVQDFILKTLMIDIREAELDVDKAGDLDDVFSLIKQYSLAAGDINDTSQLDKVLLKIVSGDTVILIEGCNKAIIVDSKGWEDRGIQEPSTQTVIRGPKDGFTETIRTNTALIRRKIKDSNLRFEHFCIGERTKTDVTISYIDGIANEKIVNEVKERLERIETDSILEGGYIEEFIQDTGWTPFPLIHNTERPDTVAAGLLEGRVAIIVDGTPFVLLAPALFVEFFQSSEDYYQRSGISILIRILRYAAFFFATLTPSAYIAVTTFHQEMLPTQLLLSLAAQREGVPFPAVIEALLMEVTFEILREAGVRMPRAVGSAISIVGALVLGQAAVEAGLVSSAMVIVVSFTAISSFVAPSYSLSISSRILRFMFMIAAATFGLYGIMLGLIVIVLHLSSLRSFGIPYLTPLAPFNAADQKDAIFRFPRWLMSRRPRLISQEDISRGKGGGPEQPDH